jgi:UDP-GlcNAc:undecaprenyl-phosphate/decaprenyl-phosphate GlcNAc-1-phosphate transferase
MYSLAFLVAVSFLLTLLITPVVRNVFRRLGVLDHPGERKAHPHAIPRVGGVAILLAYTLAYGCILFTHSSTGGKIWNQLGFVMRFLPAALIAFTTGLIDDIWALKAWQKLVGQVGAALLAYWAGIHVHSFGGYHLAHWLNIPLTVLWLVACTNAVNLIDGVDGLAAGVGLFATCTTLFAAMLQNNFALALVTAPLAGCLFGFLRYNFNPATIFLGDCGSLFIGFLLGCFGVFWSEKAATILGMTAPLMALSIPLLDTLLAIARRYLRRKPVYMADRGHIHHRLLDRGLTPRKVVLILYAFCALGATCSLLMMSQRVPGIVIIIFCAMTWIGVQHLGYIEFGTAGRMFLDGVFRRSLNSQISLQTYEEQLIAAPTPDRCWEVISTACRNAGFHHVQMMLDGESFEWEDGINPLNTWDISIPISETDYVRLTRSFGGGTQPNVIAPLADLLRRTLVPKLPVFAAVSRKPPDRVHPKVNLSEGMALHRSTGED